MVNGIALDEFDAGIVFPVAHRLPEQGLVHAAKVAVDLVRYYTKVPDAFLLGGRRPYRAMMLLVLVLVALGCVVNVAASREG